MRLEILSDFFDNSISSPMITESTKKLSDGKCFGPRDSPSLVFFFHSFG